MTPAREGENYVSLSGMVRADLTSDLVWVQPLTRCATLEVPHGCATCPVPALPQVLLGPQHYGNMCKGSL